MSLKRHLRDALVCTTASIARIPDQEVFLEVFDFVFEQILDLEFESQLLNAFQQIYKHNEIAFISTVAMDRESSGRPLRPRRLRVESNLAKHASNNNLPTCSMESQRGDLEQ